MGIDLATLPNNIEELKLLVTKLGKEIRRLECENEVLSDELELARYKIFGRRSEKLTEEDVNVKGISPPSGKSFPPYGGKEKSPILGNRNSPPRGKGISPLDGK